MTFGELVAVVCMAVGAASIAPLVGLVLLAAWHSLLGAWRGRRARRRALARGGEIVVDLGAVRARRAMERARPG